jgi:hypothetical protein
VPQLKTLKANAELGVPVLKLDNTVNAQDFVVVALPGRAPVDTKAISNGMAIQRFLKGKQGLHASIVYEFAPGTVAETDSRMLGTEAGAGLWFNARADLIGAERGGWGNINTKPEGLVVAPDIGTVLIIGGGHNGLVCAFYLAAAGLKVRMLERRDDRRRRGGDRGIPSRLPQFGGELHRQPAAAQGDRRHALADHGYRVIERPISNFLPLPGGRSVPLRRRTHARRDRAASRRATLDPPWADYNAMLERVVGVLRELRASHAAQHRRPASASLDWLGSYAVAKRRSTSTCAAAATCSTCSPSPPATFLDGWFEARRSRRCSAGTAVVGNFASPYTPGSAYVLLHHVFGEVNGKTGRLGPCDRRHGRDHPGDAQGMRGARRRITPMRRSRRSSSMHGRASACGWPRSGRECAMPAHRGVVQPQSEAAVQRKIVAREHLDDDTRAAHRTLPLRLGHVPHERGAVRTAGFQRRARHAAAAASPDRHPDRAVAAVISRQAYFDAKSKAHNAGWARAPMVEMVISSTLDDTLARRPASTSPACSASR